MTKEQFIAEVAKYVQKYAPQYGISVCSPIIAQACLESAYGTSAKAKYHNYFGLKYRQKRVKCHSGYFVDGGAEQKDGLHLRGDCLLKVVFCLDRGNNRIIFVIKHTIPHFGSVGSVIFSRAVTRGL